VQEWELPHFKPTIFYKWVYVELLNNKNIYIYMYSLYIYITLISMIIYTHMYYMHPFPGVILPDSQGKSIWWYLDPPAKLPVVISLRCHGVKAGRAAGGKGHLLQGAPLDTRMDNVDHFLKHSSTYSEQVER
jgi:hypothetical protein